MNTKMREMILLRQGRLIEILRSCRLNSFLVKLVKVMLLHCCRGESIWGRKLINIREDS